MQILLLYDLVNNVTLVRQLLLASAREEDIQDVKSREDVHRISLKQGA